MKTNISEVQLRKLIRLELQKSNLSEALQKKEVLTNYSGKNLRDTTKNALDIFLASLTIDLAADISGKSIEEIKNLPEEQKDKFLNDIYNDLHESINNHVEDTIGTVFSLGKKKVLKKVGSETAPSTNQKFKRPEKKEANV